MSINLTIKTNQMRKFKEFEAIFHEENDILGTKSVDNGKIMINLYSVVAWNECTDGTVTVELEGGIRYGLNISYQKFSRIIFDETM